MRTLTLLSLALCAAPALAQTGDPLLTLPRPPEVQGQIKQDLDALAKLFNYNQLESDGPYFVFGSRKGYFGYREWLSQNSPVFRSRILYVDSVKVTGNEGGNVIATVTYSFRPKDNPNPEISEGWKKMRQEVVRFKRGPSIYQKGEMWQIVPPDASPGELTTSSDIPQNANFWNIVAYHLAQKQPYKKSGTPAERSLMQMQDLRLATEQFAQDYDLIYAFDPRYIFKALEPYLVNTASFSVPDVNEFYTFNGNLSGLKTRSRPFVYGQFDPNPHGLYDLKANEVEALARTVMFYEGQNEKPIFRYNGKAAICFADGHVALVSPDEARKLIWKP